MSFLNKQYGNSFYADRDSITRCAAKAILSCLFEKLKIESVCDVGCGVGTWLATGQALGAKTIQGFEGSWVADRPLAIKREWIAFCDLEHELPTDQRYDLVISLEVAEHLSPSRAESFVNELCALGDVVLFSGAVPGQGGIGHVNEHWQSYWAKFFLQHDYRVFDAIRPKVWADQSVPWWYRQNALVYARHGSQAAIVLADAEVRDLPKLDVVHPDLYELRTRSSLKQIVRALWHTILNRTPDTHRTSPY